MDTKTTTRTRLPLVKFGGKIWELLQIEYATATIKRYQITARVEVGRLEPMNDSAVNILGAIQGADK